MLSGHHSLWTLAKQKISSSWSPGTLATDRNTTPPKEKCQHSDHSRVTLRRSDQRPLARARKRTLKMTITIVTVFACCWLPYATMTLWYMLDRQSAEHVSAKVQDLFFIMAVSNSCMDPLVYGSYTLEPSTFTRTLRKIFCIHTRPTVIPGTVFSLDTNLMGACTLNKYRAFSFSA
ncbi:hypothetical protein evm_001104 [Chilo suppressalis]|nr:hypothetical protein evm_001104 [Chilo suppressalis]